MDRRRTRNDPLGAVVPEVSRGGLDHARQARRVHPRNHRSPSRGTTRRETPGGCAGGETPGGRIGGRTARGPVPPDPGGAGTAAEGQWIVVEPGMIRSVQLFQRYREEVLTMPDKLEEFTRETIDRLLEELPVEKRLEGVPVEKRLEGVSVEELLAALSPQTREALARRLFGKDEG